MPVLNPKESWFSACFRVDDLDALYAEFAKVGMPTDCWSMPRIGEIKVEPRGILIFYFVDLDGSLIRCIDNKFEA